ncbi:MAG: glycosyltransferase family 4 protein [Tepidisphaeraceae bacterium]
MKRLHFVITDLEIGGTPRVVRELAIRLRDYDFDTAVTCLSPWGPVADEIQAAGVPVFAAGAKGPAQLPAAVKFVRHATASADTIFSFLVHANVVAALANAGRGLPLVQSIQTTQPRPGWHWWAQAVAAKAARKIIVPTPSTASVAAERSGIDPAKIVVIPNAVDACESPTQRRASDAAFRVGFLGRLDPVKRVPDLVAAVAKLPDVTLDIFGDGPERQAIVGAIRESGIGDRATLHGTYASAATPLGKIDVLVLPSEAEGFGLVLIEAMAAGVPTIGTDVPGIRDVIRHGDNGLLVPVNAPAALAAALTRVRDDASLVDRLVTNGRKTVAERYAWDAVLRQYARRTAKDLCFVGATPASPESQR